MKIIPLRKVLEIAFETIELRDICEDKELAISTLGQLLGSWLINRLADILAAETIIDLPWELEEIQLSKKPNPILILHYNYEYKIGLCANHVNNIVHLDEPVDWNQVKKIKLLQID